MSLSLGVDVYAAPGAGYGTIVFLLP